MANETINVNDLSSRTEKILGSMTGDYSGDLENPKSRVEALLLKLNEELKNISTSSGGLKAIKKVDSLPATGEEGYLYLVKKENPSSDDDLYDEWFYTDGRFEKLDGNGSSDSEVVIKAKYNDADETLELFKS